MPRCPGQSDRPGLNPTSHCLKTSPLSTYQHTAFDIRSLHPTAKATTMPQTTRRPIRTHISNITGNYSLKTSSRSRASKTKFRSTPERSNVDDFELQHLLPSSSRDISEDQSTPTEADEVRVFEDLNTSQDGLLRIISGTREFDTGDSERTNSASLGPETCRRVVSALETLIRDIDEQDHEPPRWTHVRPWLVSSTRNTPRTRPNTTSANSSFTQLEVPPAVRRYLAASRHESWDDRTRKAARTVRTWVGYDVIAKAVAEVDAAKKAKATNDVWNSWWAV
jgi:hypothetical protein